MAKKVKIIGHIDADGAAFPYVLYKLLSINVENTEFEIEYGHLSTIYEKLIKDFEYYKTLSREELENTYILVHDIGGLGEPSKILPIIHEMQEMGLNFAYIDHHESLDSNNMVLELDYMYYSTDRSKCASIMGYTVLLQSFFEQNKFSSINEFFDYLEIKDEFTREHLRSNLEALKQENQKKIGYQKEFFEKILNIKSLSLENCGVRDILRKSAELIKFVDFVDRGKINKSDDEFILKEYLNYSTEHSGKDLFDIMASIETVLDVPKECRLLEQTKQATVDIKEKYKVKERIEDSIKNVQIIKIIGESGQKYNAAVFFAEGDIRFDLEGQRFKMNEVLEKNNISPMKIDAVITFSQYSIGKDPIISIKPIGKSNVVRIADDAFKKMGYGCRSNAGIPIGYDRDKYSSLAKLRWDALKNEGNPIELNNRIKMKGIMNRVLLDVFDFEVVDMERFEKKVEHFALR